MRNIIKTYVGQYCKWILLFESKNTIQLTVTISNNLYTDADELSCPFRTDIKDFTVEKVDYSAPIYCCVDVSAYVIMASRPAEG